MKLVLLIIVIFFKRNANITLLILSAIAFLTFLELQFGILTPRKILLEGVIGTYQEHDLPPEVTSLLSEGLVKIDNFGNIEPNIASSWEINNDATEFKFHLKDHINWVDGSPIRASDISFNIPDVEIIIPNEKTIQFKLKEPYSPLPTLLTKPVFKKNAIIGTGPYSLKKIEKSRIFITKIVLIPKMNNLPELVIRFYPNEKVAITGFKLGEVQVLLGVGDIGQIEESSKIRVKKITDLNKIVSILYSMDGQLLGTRSVRQALSFSAPIIEGEEIANNPFSHASWAYDSEAKKYLARNEEAKLALERAKTSLSENQLAEDLVLTTTPNLEHVAKAVAEAWKSAGFNVKIRVESGIPQNFQALLITQSIPQDPDQYALWHSSQTKTNLTKYSSVRVDKDLEDGRKSQNLEDRKKSYFDFQKILLEDAPATFLFFPKFNVVYLNKVEHALNQVLPLHN